MNTTLTSKIDMKYLLTICFVDGAKLPGKPPAVSLSKPNIIFILADDMHLMRSASTGAS